MRSLGRAWSGACELQVELADQTQVRALLYPQLVGEVDVGDRVSLTTSALHRGLGTGGYAFVAAVPDRLPPDPAPGPGHIMKARYTPLQSMVASVDEQESPWHQVLAEADDLSGLPVVVADLHSALPAIVAGARLLSERHGAPPPRVAYVMTDGAALPLWFSRTVAALREADWLAASIAVGQSFGGDYEAVTTHTGLLAAHHVVGADLVVVAQGPGNVGTGTRWGFSGVAAGEAINAVSVLGGRPIASVRVSGADPRERHLGVSHHSITAFTRVALRPAEVPLPEFDGNLSEVGRRVAEQAGAFTRAGHHVTTVPTEGLLSALAAAPVSMSTMGRSLTQDPASFLTAGVAGIRAATLTGLPDRDQRG